MSVPENLREWRRRPSRKLVKHGVDEYLVHNAATWTRDQPLASSLATQPAGEQGTSSTAQEHVSNSMALSSSLFDSSDVGAQPQQWPPNFVVPSLDPPRNTAAPGGYNVYQRGREQSPPLSAVLSASHDNFPLNSTFMANSNPDRGTTSLAGEQVLEPRIVRKVRGVMIMREYGEPYFLAVPDPEGFESWLASQRIYRRAEGTHTGTLTYDPYAASASALYRSDYPAPGRLPEWAWEPTTAFAGYSEGGQPGHPIVNANDWAPTIDPAPSLWDQTGQYDPSSSFPFHETSLEDRWQYGGTDAGLGGVNNRNS